MVGQKGKVRGTKRKSKGGQKRKERIEVKVKARIFKKESILFERMEKLKRKNLLMEFKENKYM